MLIFVTVLKIIE